MYYVGIDISKYKHDCFICTETGEVIQENLSFANTNEGFFELLNLLKSLDNSKQIRIGFEATGHSFIYKLSNIPLSKSSMLYIVSNSLNVSSKFFLALSQPVPSVNHIKVTPSTLLDS